MSAKYLTLPEAGACHRLERAIEGLAGIGAIDEKERTRVMRHAKAIRALIEARFYVVARQATTDLEALFAGTDYHDPVQDACNHLRRVMRWEATA